MVVNEYKDILTKLESLALSNENNIRGKRQEQLQARRERAKQNKLLAISEEDGNKITDMLKRGYSVESLFDYFPNYQKLHIVNYIKKRTDFVETQNVLLSKNICMEILCLKHIGFTDEAIKWIVDLDDDIYERYINYFYLELSTAMKNRMLARGLETQTFLDTGVTYMKLIDLIECLHFKMELKDIRKVTGLKRASIIECIELLKDYGVDETELKVVNIISVIPYIWNENEKREKVLKGFKERVATLHSMGYTKPKIAMHLDVDIDLIEMLFTKNGKKMLK